MLDGSYFTEMHLTTVYSLAKVSHQQPVMDVFLNNVNQIIWNNGILTYKYKLRLANRSTPCETTYYYLW